MKLTSARAFLTVIALSAPSLGLLPFLNGLQQDSEKALPESISTSYAGFESLFGFVTSYAIAIDDKNATKLAALFAPNAVATYTSPDQTVNGSSAIAMHNLDIFSGLNTFHSLVPMAVQPTDLNGTVEVTTYFTATIFGRDCYIGQVVSSQGRYTDIMKYINGAWAIMRRTQTYANPADPYVGNVAIVLGPTCNSTGVKGTDSSL